MDWKNLNVVNSKEILIINFKNNSDKIIYFKMQWFLVLIILISFYIFFYNLGMHQWILNGDYISIFIFFLPLCLFLPVIFHKYKAKFYEDDIKLIKFLKRQYDYENCDEIRYKDINAYKLFQKDVYLFTSRIEPYEIRNLKDSEKEQIKKILDRKNIKSANLSN